jgi:hypothetical protein
MMVMTGREYNAYAVRVDILAFGGGGSDRRPVGIRGHSIRQQVRVVGCGYRLHHSCDRVLG